MGTRILVGGKNRREEERTKNPTHLLTRVSNRQMRRNACKNSQPEEDGGRPAYVCN